MVEDNIEEYNFKILCKFINMLGLFVITVAVLVTVIFGLLVKILFF